MLVLAVVAGLVAVDRSRDADASRADAELAALVDQSLALRGTSRSAAALLAVEAVRHAPADACARSALLGSFTAAPGFLGHRYLPDHEQVGGTLLPGTDRAVVTDGRAWGCSMSPPATTSCRSSCPTTAGGSTTWRSAGMPDRWPCCAA